MSPNLPPLAIGAVLGDSDAESMSWSRSIGELSREVAEQSGTLRESISLSVAFHVDGRLAPNDFAGVRMGRFSRKDQRLVVQVAVNRDVTELDKRAHLISLLKDAITQADHYARQKGWAEGIEGMRGLVEALS